MKNTVKRLISFRMNHYKDIELKLEKMAEKGLFLEKIGTYLWTFRKAEPKKVRYTVTYFSEASIFNPTLTENQKKFHDLAKEKGWNFVAEFNQMQIFFSEEEQPVPLEANEKEKFENIKRCMKKSFLPSHIILILLFLYNIGIQYFSFKDNPLDFLAKTSNLFMVAVMLPTLIYLCYILFAYFIWCKQCERSISVGGGCIDRVHKYQKIVDIALVSYVFILVGLLFFDLFKKINLLICILTVIYVPILIFVYRFSIYFLKKKKKSAMTNRVISFILLGAASFAYMFSILTLSLKFDFPIENEGSYRIVTCQITPLETREYKIYSDDIPLTCEDLYGNINYENYSYEKNEDNSIFLIRSLYQQDSLPEQNAPPEIWYETIEPKYNFVYDIIVEDFKKMPERSECRLKEIDNSIFNTEEAYKICFIDDMEDGSDYLLIYKNKIILLNFEEPLSEQQCNIIVEKLKLS